MRNILLIYRGQVFDTEIKPKLDQYKNDNVVLVIDNKLTRKIIGYITKDYEQKINIITIHEYLNKGVVDNMKFDVIIGNPPYQLQVGPGKTQTIWDSIVEKSLKLLCSGGTMTMIHPSNWRNISGNQKELQKKIFSYDLKSIEIYNESQGLKTFGAETRYDIYTLEKTKVNKTNTKVKFQDGTEATINVKELEFIPNSNYEKIKSLLAKYGEETAYIIHNNIHHTQRKYMKESTDSINKYPCVYTVRSGDEPTFWYSPFNNKGHFGESKLIFSNGRISSIGSFIDTNGEYGLCQFSSGIVDTPENLPLIKKAFDSIEFRNLMESCSVGDMSVNHKILKLFRKDFWKEFV